MTVRHSPSPSIASLLIPQRGAAYFHHARMQTAHYPPQDLKGDYTVRARIALTESGPAIDQSLDVRATPNPDGSLWLARFYTVDLRRHLADMDGRVVYMIYECTGVLTVVVPLRVTF